MSDMDLSNRQIFWMMVSTQIIMTILLTTSPAAQMAKQDAWISILLATLVGMAIAYICGKLNVIFPGRTLAEYNRILLGKWLGWVITALYILVWLVILTVILQQFSLFITGTIMPKTPLYVVEVPMLLVVLYPTLHGVGVIARICEITGPIILLCVVGPMLLGINQMNGDRLFPILLDNNVMSIMKGALPTSAFLADCILLMVLIAFVSKRKHTVRYAVSGVMLSGVLTTLSIIVSILMFGPNVAAAYPYPMLMIVRSISIGGIIENLDAIVVSIWIISIFTKLGLYLFVASYGASQLLGLQNWKIVTWITALVVMLLSFIPVNYEEISIIFPQKIAAPIIFPIFMVIGPLVLLMLALMKRKKLKPASQG
ncbi:endospore germination permease [Paenibacillus qinlingensis]|uniref:Spore germination protein KB n=1 Tax=Paenibacillus qinlingensis TaxID=1837343 RepID=A0ABU1NXE6_9BACL|nr:endospore germination permease [Paenibacillus qinlingensis]MDR6552174.1 spore germination protein KB [Paenibacillus qinlingensis]